MRNHFIFTFMLLTSAALFAAAEMPVFSDNAVILFQGDSITDGKRGRNSDPNHILGHGYAFIIAAKFGSQLAERNLTFINRGVSANKVTDLRNRWKQDALDLKPTLLSILVGVNDTRDKQFEEFEQTYDKLLADTRAALPQVKLVLCEPFALPTGAKKNVYDAWLQDIVKMQEIVARLAAKHSATLVKFQKVFDEACKRAPAEHWIWDGVHPTYSGHQLMADEWIKTVSEMK